MRMTAHEIMASQEEWAQRNAPKLKAINEELWRAFLGPVAKRLGELLARETAK